MKPLLALLTLLAPVVAYADEPTGDPDADGAAPTAGAVGGVPTAAPSAPIAGAPAAVPPVPSATEPAPANRDSLATPETGDPDYRSPAAALTLSVIPTLGGVLLTWYGSTLYDTTEARVVTAGLIIANLGPTVGNIYAGDVWNRGLQLRLAGVGVGLLGVGLIVASNCVIECRGSQGLANVGAGVFAIGGIAYGIGGLIEIVNAPDAAQRRRARRSVAVAPAIAPGSAGAMIGGTF